MVSKRKLWVFGDSFSSPYSEMLDYSHTQALYVKEYYKQLNKFPTHFTDVLQNYFNFKEIVNIADGGLDNYSILEKIGEHINLIKPEDFVCIGWTDITRYRFIYRNTKNQYSWARMLVNGKLLGRSKDSSYLENTYTSRLKDFQEQSIQRDCILTLNEIKNWQNILKAGLPINTLFWSPFKFQNYINEVPFHTIPLDKNIEKIKEASTINDEHFSSTGHKQLGEYLLRLFLDPLYSKTVI